MSSGVSSGQSFGIGESQISLENYEYAQKLAEIQAEIYTSNLTDAQKSTVNTVVNTISQHLTEQDYSGVQRDIAGNPVPNGKGGFFDHIHEMRDSYRALKRAQRSLEGSLKNPNLGSAERALLGRALGTTNDHLLQIETIFRPYGGIEKWKKK